MSTPLNIDGVNLCPNMEVSLNDAGFLKITHGLLREKGHTALTVMEINAASALKVLALLQRHEELLKIIAEEESNARD